MKKLIVLAVTFLTIAASVDAGHRHPRGGHSRGGGGDFVDGFFAGILVSSYILSSIEDNSGHYSQEMIQLEAIEAQNNFEMFGDYNMSELLFDLVGDIQTENEELSTGGIITAFANGEGLEL